MDLNLFPAAKFFSPPIKHRRKKKKNDDKDPGKLSMKNKTPTQMNQKPQPPQYRETNPFLSSDESEPEVVQLKGNINDWITDDETDHNPKSTTTSKTSASYVTCLTNQQGKQIVQRYEFEISEDEDDDSNEITAIHRTQQITYQMSEDGSEPELIVQTTVQTKSATGMSKIFEQSSTEKVKIWLKKIKAPEQLSPKAARRLEMAPSTEPVTGSQTSSSGYPYSVATEKSRFSSMGATSRQESSPDGLSKNNSPGSQNSPRLLNERNRNSLTSEAISSQATSSSRSSSFYFKDRPHWSKSSPGKKKPRANKPPPPKYSQVSSAWSDAKSTQETTAEESLRLQVSEEPNNENIYNEEDIYKNFAEKFNLSENETEAPNKKKSNGTACCSTYADTVPRISDICSSSEEFQTRPQPLHEITNHFNPVLSSTHRDSVFGFPSYNTDEQESLNKTLNSPTNKIQEEEEDSPTMQTVRRRHVIDISSDEETHFETANENSNSAVPDKYDSDEEQESPDRIIRRPTRASYIELLTSDSEAESIPARKIGERHEVPETDDEDEVEDNEASASSLDQNTEVQNARKLNFSTQESDQDEDGGAAKKTSEEEDVIENSQSSEESSGEEDILPVKPSPQRAIVPVTSPAVVQRRRYISSESEDDLEIIDNFFKKHREQKKQVKKELPEDVAEKDDSFIVPDDVIEIESDEDLQEVEKDFSPSFYLRVINDRRRADNQIDLSIKGGNLNEIRKQFTQPLTPPPKTKVTVARTDPRTPAKPRFVEKADYSPCLGFLASLSSNNHHRCDPDAVPYLKKFSNKKDDLVERLFLLFNETVFDNKLDKEMSITWNNRLRSTAGFCYNQRKKISEDTTIRISRIELSGKILTNAAQLRDTLIHEMCHAATWVIDGTLGGHGPVWKKWTRRAKRLHSDLPEIKRCHSYTIETKFTYKCTKCTYSFGRHSKSLDLQRKVCGICRGSFELIVNNTKRGAAAGATPKKPNAFALFVQENYKIVKQKDMAHKEVMQTLSQKFKEAKIQNA